MVDIQLVCIRSTPLSYFSPRSPNRAHPHRIGLVFYQHKNLHHPGHGAEEFRRKRAIREFRDYAQWINGNLVPTESKLRAMQESGFSFPEEVKTLEKPMDVARPEDFFRSESYEGYEEELAKIKRLCDAIPREPDHGLDIVYVEKDEEELCLSV